MKISLCRSVARAFQNEPQKIALAGAFVLLAPSAFSPTLSVARTAERSISSTRSSLKNAGLSFDVTARLVALQHGKASDMPAQTFDARVYLKGDKARVETEIGDRPAVYLLTPPYLTKLLPDSKAGARWKVNARGALPGATGAGLGNTLQSLMRDPSSLRATLRRSGARLTATGMLNGTPVETYVAPNFLGGGQKLTAWLRRSDALPMRAQLNSKTLASTLSWSNYKRAALPDTLFKAPPGYNVRNSTGQPSF